MLQKTVYKETAFVDNKFDYSKFQKNLSDLIYSNGKTLRATASDVGIAFPTLSRYINGHRIPELDSLIALVQYYNVPIGWLLGFNEDRYDTLPPESRELLDLYKLASPDDRRVVDTILNKYREEK